MSRLLNRLLLASFFACGLLALAPQASAALLFTEPTPTPLVSLDSRADLNIDFTSDAPACSLGSMSAASQPPPAWRIPSASPLYRLLFDEFALPLAHTAIPNHSATPTGAGSSSSHTGPTQTQTGVSSAACQFPTLQITLQQFSETETSLPPPPTSDLFRPPRRIS